MNKKMLALLLVISLALGNAMSVSATEKTMYYISAYTSADDSFCVLPVLKAEGEAYISITDAAKVSGMEYENDGGSLVFKKGYHKIEYKGKYVSYNGEKYYRMKDIMDGLSTIYQYSEDTQMLCFIACESFITNLWSDCMNIKMGTDYDYSMEYLVNQWGVELTVLINILKNGAVDVAWGGYQRGQYETALKGILLPSQSESDAIELAMQANGIMKTLSKGYKAGVDIFGKAEMVESIGKDAAEIMDIYGDVSDIGLNMKFGDCLDIIETIYTAKNASQTYVNAVKYGLYKNKSIKDNNLKNAVKTVYMHYDEEQPTTADIFNEIGLTIADNTMTDLLEKAIEESFGLKNAYLDVMNIILDEVFHLDKPLDAVTQGLMCHEIQKEALDQLDDCLNRKTLALKNPLQMKYTTLLYLRAAQYAADQFEGTGNLAEWANEVRKEPIQNAINKLVAYSDEELTRETDNSKVSFKWKGLRTNASEVLIEDDAAQEGENESATSETISPSNTPTNKTPSNSEENGASGTVGTITTGTFGIVDVVGKPYEEAEVLLKENGFILEGEGYDGSECWINTPEEKSILSGPIYPSGIPFFEQPNGSINISFPITKELTSNVTIEQAKTILAKTSYKIKTIEDTIKIALSEDQSIIKEVPRYEIEVTNGIWTFSMRWSSGVVYWNNGNINIGTIKENYNMYKDNIPQVYIQCNAFYLECVKCGQGYCIDPNDIYSKPTTCFQCNGTEFK